MKRILLTLTVCLLPFTAAQDEVPCTEADPCIWDLSVDENGFSGLQREWNFTVGDWYYLNVDNLDFDEETHTIYVDQLGIALEVQGLGNAKSEPFAFTEETEIFVRDEPTFDEVVAFVWIEDAIALEQGEPVGSADDTPPQPSGETKDSPSIGIIAVLGLLGAALITRRK